MKYYTRKLLSLLLIAVMCMSSFSFSVFAEDDAPLIPDSTEEQANLETQTSQTTSSSIVSSSVSYAGKYAKFSWNKVEFPDASSTKYAIRCWYSGSTYDTGKSSFIKTGLSTTSYTMTKGLNSSLFPYRYQVVAYPSGETPDWTTATVQTLTCPSDALVPAATVTSANYTYSDKATNKKKLGEIKQKDNTITVKWTVEDPSLYTRFEVCRQTEKGTIVSVGTVTATDKTSYSSKVRATKGVSKFFIRAYGTSASCQSVFVQSAKVVGPAVLDNLLTDGADDVKSNLSWKAVAKKTITLYASPGGSKVTTVPKGTELKATFGFAPETFSFWEEPSWVEVNYDGDTLWAKWSQVKMKWVITHKDYSWSVKESFVNSAKCKSKTSYLIWVSRYTQRTNIFHKENGKWRLIKVYDCNTGNYYQPLKGGQYYVSSHEAMKVKVHENGREYYFRYSTKFHGSGTFHTRCRWVDTGNLRNAIKRHPTTKGCCRLYDAAAKYVYNLPGGTGVYIH